MISDSDKFREGYIRVRVKDNPYAISQYNTLQYLNQIHIYTVYTVYVAAGCFARSWLFGVIAKLYFSLLITIEPNKCKLTHGVSTDVLQSPMNEGHLSL